MSNPTRILFVSGEVKPYTPATEIANLVRTLPEHLQESGKFDTRIMIPKYGTISERKQNLHEVIRLSGNKITLGGKTVYPLKVKVASIPQARLQVYFMDNRNLFRRKKIYMDKEGVELTNNFERSLFFGKSVLRTIMKLGWQPDIVHVHGWISSFVPILLRTTFAEFDMFKNVKIVYTPDAYSQPETVVNKKMLAMLDLPADHKALNMPVDSLGKTFADSTTRIKSEETALEDARYIEIDTEEQIQDAMAFYENLLTEASAIA